jgi:hypothetical protein
VAVYQDDEIVVDEASEQLRLDAGTTVERDVEAMLGRFVDVGWSYRFGPAIRSLVVASLELESTGGAEELLSQAFRFPLGRPAAARPVAEIGLRGHVRLDGDGQAVATLGSTRYAHGVRLTIPGFVASDDAFGLEPGHQRQIRLERSWSDGAAGTAADRSVATAANVLGPVALAWEDPR